MLYNPEWDKPNLDGFISFLETKPRDELYAWVDCDKCAIGQYFKSIGKTYDMATGDMNTIVSYNYWESGIAAPTPHTFGAALDRACKVREHRKELMPCR